MSYGDETPITSSDDGDDNQVINEMNVTMGGFTETTLDGTPHSDDSDDNDIDMNVHPEQGPESVIRIHYEGHVQAVAISAYDTLGDVRCKLTQSEDIEMSASHYFLLPASGDRDYLDLDSGDCDADDVMESGRLLVDETVRASKYIDETLSIYWKSFGLKILDGMDLSLDLKVSQDWSIKKVKDEVERNHNVRLQCLSYHGMELVDDQQLEYHNITQSGFTLISRISVTVEDHTCDICTDLLICDFWDFDAVLRTYLDAERREEHENGEFYYLGNKVSLSEQVFALKLKNRSKLEYKVDAYSINIYDSESAAHADENDLNAFTLQVYDYWTLNDVKKSYSKITKKPFMEKEKFLSQERELEDDVPLWKLRIRDNERLIIEREQQEVVVTYSCCECGAIVNLRRYDSVQCRECFHGAVYKQRSSRVCQYSCR